MKNKNAQTYYLNKEYDKAYKLYLELAKESNIDAMMQVAYMLINGEGVTQDIDAGYLWYKEAAEHNRKAQYYYGWYCLDHNNNKEGKFYLDKAVENKYIEAMYDVAKFYADGEYGYSIDSDKSVYLYTQVCLASKKGACINLYILNKRLIGKSKALQYIKKHIGYLKYLKILIFHTCTRKRY